MKRKMKSMIRCLALALCLVCLFPAWGAARGEEPTRLTLYEGPKTMKTSETAAVSVNGYDLFVYDVMVNHQHIYSNNALPSYTPMTYFDMEGKVNVEIAMPGLGKPVESAFVMPSSYGIVPTVEDGIVRFTITEPGQYTVVFNDSVNQALHIFANPLETEVPSHRPLLLRPKSSLLLRRQKSARPARS